jgi:hypothetical protein
MHVPAAEVVESMIAVDGKGQGEIRRFPGGRAPSRES